MAGRAARYQVTGLQPGDASALGPLHCRIWRLTYADLMAPEALARLTPEAFTRIWTERFAAWRAGALPGGERIYIGRDRGAPVAFLTTGEPRDTDAPADWEVWALNVAPEHQGTGLAAQLVEEAIGDRAAYLWVADGNERAIRFYLKNGFEMDGTTQARRDGMVEVRMVRGVQAAP